ncbi:Ribosomal protein L10P like protein [Aduncisulcus paluster]|uniref:Ribosomal protein L10P like protein n=1 Tax=Aduncisulcus paluster TaxID=2918883 RepID=A0ABQ5JR84_9EUKA|nr:Ribosomal protein L10P like protein [Aduncisulcus paluster]|eukprot:gnl/Carplike_NY0171/647_a889_1890.p1 GENE.gnl/Carplike_NY0171/647_a889_1890~~gnl/Carplike_NY0171/647_a889_1890.p1  ORF type:complete len:234 (-),score=74.04 gnl/Carplike_NY0171/647_a889_1890:77-778(-)
MPKSKRAQVVHTSKVQKKGKDRKTKIIQDIQKAIESFESCYVFEYFNLPARFIVDLRLALQGDVRFFMPKNSLSRVALGHDEESEFAENIHKLSEDLFGKRGLMFTSLPHSRIMEIVKKSTREAPAVCGEVASETVQIPAGTLEAAKGCPASMELQWRDLGFPTCLDDDGRIMLTNIHTVCTVGDVLTSKQAKALKLLGMNMGVAKLDLISMWKKGTYSLLVKEPEAKGEEEE